MVALQVQAAMGLSTAPTGFERGIQVQPDGAPRRREAEENAGRQRKAEGEGQNCAVDADVFEPRNIAGIHRAYDGQAQPSYQKSSSSAEQRQQNALGQQLPNQALPSRSQSAADGDFLFAACCAR